MEGVIRYGAREMKEPDITSTAVEKSSLSETKIPIPALLVAHAPRGACAVDRCRLKETFTVGRKGDNTFCIVDNKVSGHHFRLTAEHKGFVIEDLGSTNGTFVDGKMVTDKILLRNQAVIRAGRAVLVFHSDAEDLLAPPPIERYGMAGRFHVGGIVASLEEAARSTRHLLILGSSGTGKELAAEAIADMSSDSEVPLPLLAHNAARFSSEEEATSTLFGVGAKVFSNVNARPGLIEQAEGGVLFLDEIHNLTERVQRSLLRVIEDRQLSRIGETSVRKTDVRFVFASNSDNPEAAIAHDLFARLRLVKLPALKDRIADIPAIFHRVLALKLEQQNIVQKAVLPIFKGEHYELLLLDGFESDNVRGLIDLADRIATKIAGRITPAEAVTAVFTERFAHKTSNRIPSPAAQADIVPPEASIYDTMDSSVGAEASSSPYERHKDLIIAVYRDREENISATMRVLNARGISCSRRWLAVYLKKWGVKES
jgi:DNA-binding NtrC family response regulator